MKMNSFKFLNNGKRVFQFELMTSFDFVPYSFTNYECWTVDKSNLIKEWLSDFYFSGMNSDFGFEKYFPEFDRTFEILEYGVVTSEGEPKFTSKVRIYRRENEYMEVDLQYPIRHVIYLTN